MFKIKIEKEFDGTTANYDVTTKEEFMNALGGMWDMMAKDIAEKDTVWEEFLKGTEFESKKEFEEWFKEMCRHHIAYPYFNFDEWMGEAVDDYIKDETDYYSLDEITSKIDRLEDALRSIQDITEEHI